LPCTYVEVLVVVFADGGQQQQIGGPNDKILELVLVLLLHATDEKPMRK
jgi:hypothetical protein